MIADHNWKIQDFFFFFFFFLLFFFFFFFFFLHEQPATKIGLSDGNNNSDESFIGEFYVFKQTFYYSLCLASKATCVMSLDHTTYFTLAIFTEARVLKHKRHSNWDHTGKTYGLRLSQGSRIWFEVVPNEYKGQSWGFMSCSTARVILGQVLNIATCGTRTHRGDSL